MAGETVITIVGNLTADPELRTLGNGSTVANLTIASSTRQFNRQSNQWEDGDTLFMNCSAWDSQKQKLASNIVATLAKGMRVIASGRLLQRSYQAQDGSQRTVTEMRLEEIGPALTRATAQVTRVQAGGGYAGGSTYGDPTEGPRTAGRTVSHRLPHRRNRRLPRRLWSRACSRATHGPNRHPHRRGLASALLTISHRTIPTLNSKEIQCHGKRKRTACRTP